MTDPRLLLSDTRLDEIERDAAHSRRLGLTVTFAVVSEQLAFVHELRRLRQELEEARAALRKSEPAASRSRTQAAPPPARESRPPVEPGEWRTIREPRERPDPRMRREPMPSPRESVPPLEVEVTIVQRDANGHELSRVRRRMPAEERERG